MPSPIPPIESWWMSCDIVAVFSLVHNRLNRHHYCRPTRGYLCHRLLLSDTAGPVLLLVPNEPHAVYRPISRLQICPYWADQIQATERWWECSAWRNSEIKRDKLLLKNLDFSCVQSIKCKKTKKKIVCLRYIVAFRRELLPARAINAEKIDRKNASMTRTIWSKTNFDENL